MTDNKKLKEHAIEVVKKYILVLLLLVTNSFMGLVALNQAEEKDKFILEFNMKLETAQQEAKQANEQLVEVKNDLSLAKADLRVKDLVLRSVASRLGNDSIAQIAALEMPKVMEKDLAYEAKIEELEEQVASLNDSLREKDNLIDSITESGEPRIMVGSSMPEPEYPVSTTTVPEIKEMPKIDSGFNAEIERHRSE